MSNLKLITLLSKAGLLKDIKRTGWVVKGIKNAESVADHSWRMALIAMIIAPNNLNRQKLLEMCIVHDLGEIGVGDIIWERGTKVISSQEDKRSDELKVFQTLFENHNIPSPVELLQEYNDQKTLEAKFVKQVDKLEMALQALEYEKQGYSDKSLNEFWENAEKYLLNTELESIFVELKSLRKTSKKS